MFRVFILCVFCLPLGVLAGCADSQEGPQSKKCLLRSDSFGEKGGTPIKAEVVVSGLETPWGVAFLPNGDALITERPGRVRLITNRLLEKAPVITIDIGASSEGGLLGIALHPKFDYQSNRLFYLYYTTNKSGKSINRVEQFELAKDGKSAVAKKIIVDDIPAAQFHNGGRIRFGPDGNLYIGTGDARVPDLSQDKNSLAGKILRVTPDGEVPADNPFANSATYIWGIRNTQGFVWLDDSSMWVTDHGPSGDLGRRGHDEVSHATAGSNLGWPTIFGCQANPNMTSPSITWKTAVPPGGAARYTGTAIPGWAGSLLIGSLGSKHLQRVVFSPNDPTQVIQNEVYFEGDPPNGLGRIREVLMGKDGNLYLTTSNCDGRGKCPPEKDKLLRILPQ